MQPKLTVDTPGDIYEQEADRVAALVMDGAGAQLQPASVGGSAQRQAEHPGHEPDRLLTKRVAPGDTGQSPVPPIAHEVLRSPGRSLEPGARASMESSFGYDFSHVRIHTDSMAAASADAVRARAYTVGQSIVFASGEYAPDTSRGRGLLAHELTHVVQQGFGARRQGMQLKKKDGDTTAPDPIGKTRKDVLTALAEIESNWKTLANVTAPYSMLKPWAAHGNAVVGLIRAHTEAGLDALAAKDSELASAYTVAVEADKITYDYIAWHMTAYVNLLSISALVDRLTTSFAQDDRAFTGRANAERIIRQFKAWIGGLKTHSDDALALIRRDIPLVVRGGTPREVSITVTSPAIKEDVRTAFQQKTDLMRKLQLVIQQDGDMINQFLDEAFEEGLDQAADAVIEYITVRNQLGGPKRGSKAEKKKSEKPREDTKPDLQPVPLVQPDEEQKKRKCRKDPCETPLPIMWPKNLPLPSDRRPLVRTPSGDEYIEPDKRSKPQKELQEAIRAARDRGVPPPSPCFKNDAEVNAPYDAHHIHPLYLGGAEDSVNLCALRADYHQEGHPELNDQKAMLAHATWIACRICSGYLPSHPAQQEYEIAGRK